MTKIKHYHKKIIFGMVVLFCFCTGAYKLFFYADHIAEQNAIDKNIEITRLTTAEISQIQEGDIILRRGFGFISDFIATNMNPGNVDVTHAGIIVKQDDSLFVIHSLSSDVSESDGVQIQPLNDFLNYSTPGKIIITRTKNTDAAFGKQVQQHAFSYLAKHIPFDRDGIIDNDEEFFCTELIWNILEKDLNKVILPTEYNKRKDFFYSMGSMYNTDYFDVVINQYNK